MRFFGNLPALIVGLLGICMPLFGHAVQSANGGVAPALTCAAAVDPFAQQVEPIQTYFDEASKKHVTIYWSRQDFHSSEFVTTVHRTLRRLSDTPVTISDTTAFDRYLEAVKPLVDKANEYFEKYRGWGTGGSDETGENPFSKKNIKVARDYLALSSYVIVHDHQGKLLGGMRNIQMRDQKGNVLPEEKFLHVEVPRMGLAKTVPNVVPWKNEAGTFVIDDSITPDMHQKVRLEIWTHLFQFIFSKGSVRENYYDQAVHTYGDRKSVIMYKASGFQKLRIYYLNGELVDYTHLSEKEIPAIMIDGEPWWPLVLLPQDAMALNEKFSTTTRAQVDPSWLENRRREMSEPEVSTLQMGALFPNLIADISSDNEPRFLAALTGLATIVESASEHMAVAYSAIRDRRTTDLAVQEIIKIREQLFELVKTLGSKYATMNEEKKLATVLFVGHLVRLGDKATQFMPNSMEFIDKVVFHILADPNIVNSEMMMRYLASAWTPKKWIEGTALAWDYSMDSEDEFAADTQEASQRVVQRLQQAGLSQEMMDNTVKKLEKALFEKPIIHGDPNSVYRVDYRYSMIGIMALKEVSKNDPKTISDLIKLAAARRYLQDRGQNR